MRGRLHQYFIFSRAERMGLVALACLLVLLVAARYIMHLNADAALGKSLEYQLVTACEMANTKSTRAKIDLPEHQDKHSGYVQPLPDTVNINTADSATLVQLVGIGPVTTHNIIMHRTTKGAFTSLEQLREVGSFTDEVLNVLGRHLRFSDAQVK